MMSLKIRFVCYLVDALSRYQEHLETQQWLRLQRRKSIRIPGLSGHLAKDIGADPDGVLRPAVEGLKQEHTMTEAAWLERQQHLPRQT